MHCRGGGPSTPTSARLLVMAQRRQREETGFAANGMVKVDHEDDPCSL